jgi:polar amino acid transport system substrate-binding protein
VKKAIVGIFLLSLMTLAPVIDASAGSVMERILSKGELVVGTSGAQPPLTAVSKTGQIIGMDADMARAMADAMGVTVSFKILPFAELLPALETGQVDVILSGMTITPARNRTVAFVGPYLASGKGILTLSDRYAALQEAHGLNAPEVNIAVLKGSTSQEYAQALMPKATLMPTDSYEAAIDSLLQKKADVVVADYPFCALTAYRYQGKGLLAGKAPLTFEPLGIAMAEDSLLINWTQNFMVLLQGSGQLKSLHQKWLTGGQWVDQLP